MNMTLIIVGILFVVFAVVGYWKGFIKIVASLAATILTIVLVTVMTPFVSDFLLKTLPLEQTMQEKCDEILLDALGEGMSIDTIDGSREQQITAIENAKIPDFFRQLLLANNKAEIYASLGVNTFTDYIGSYFAKLIANILAFLLLAVVVTIVVQILLGVLGVIGKLPVVGGINRLAGGVLGLAIALILVWVFFLLITLLYNTGFGRQCFADISENAFLKYLYDNNILMNYLTKFRV